MLGLYVGNNRPDGTKVSLRCECDSIGYLSTPCVGKQMNCSENGLNALKPHYLPRLDKENSFNESNEQT